jgi:hypothetical protein
MILMSEEMGIEKQRHGGGKTNLRPDYLSVLLSVRINHHGGAQHMTGAQMNRDNQ